MADTTLTDRVRDWFTERCDQAEEQIVAVADYDEALHIELRSVLDLDCLIDALHQSGYETRQETVEDTFVVEALRVTPTADGPERKPVGVPYTSTKEIVIPKNRIDEDALGNTEAFQHLSMYFEHKGPVEE